MSYHRGHWGELLQANGELSNGEEAKVTFLCSVAVDLADDGRTKVRKLLAIASHLRKSELCCLLRIRIIERAGAVGFEEEAQHQVSRSINL